MCAKLRFRLDYGSGFVEKPPPKNSQGITISAIWNALYPNATVNGIDFIWTGQNAKDLNTYRTNGNSGGNGIMEGVGLQIDMETSPNTNNWRMFFDGYIATGDIKTKWSCDEVIAPSIETGKIDWFNDKIKSVSFGTLASLPVGSLGRIVPATDYKLVPYCTVKYQQELLQKALLLIQEFTIIDKAAEALRLLNNDITKLTSDSTAEATVLPPAGMTPVVVGDIVIIIYDIVYLFGIIIALIAETKAVIDSIWQFKKYKLAMTEKQHWGRMCQRLGLQFSSSIYTSGDHVNATWMPKKTFIPSNSNPLNLFVRGSDESINFPNNPDHYGHYDGNCSGFVQTMCNKYNAGINISLNPNTGVRTLFFEEIHNWNNQAVMQIPNTDAVGYNHNLPDPHRTNLSELPFNYLVEFATDNSDEGTLYRYKGTTCEKQILPNVVYNTLRTISGKGVTVSLECARAERKDYLNKVENFINTIINGFIAVAQSIINTINTIRNTIAAIINFFGGNIPINPPVVLPTNLLFNRLGWLVLSDDQFSTPKSFNAIASGTDWKIHPSNENTCSALSLMNQFHYKNLPTHGAQQDLYDNRHIKFCVADWVAIIDKNVATAPDGISLAKFTKIDWNIHTESANVDYGIYRQETGNLHEITMIDGK